MAECVCVREGGWLVGDGGWGGAGRAARSESMPQIVARCRSLSAVRFWTGR